MDFMDKLRIQDISAAEQAETMVSQYVAALQVAVEDQDEIDAVVSVFQQIRQTLRDEMKSMEQADNISGAVVAFVGMFGAEFLSAFNDDYEMDGINIKQRRVVKKWMDTFSTDAEFRLRDFIINVRDTICDELAAQPRQKDNNEICKWITLIGADRFLVMMADNRSNA